MVLPKVIWLGLSAVSLAACGSVVDGSSLLAAPAVPSVQHSQRNATKYLRIPGKSCCEIAIDSGLDQIYVSQGVNISGNYTTVIDGKNFSVVARVNGFGGALSVDSKTHNVWLAGLHSGSVEVYSGLTDSAVTTVSLGYCPVASWVDPNRRHAWVSAQCGAGSDPVWAIDADTYKIIAGPIHTHGIMGTTTVNSATGRFYVNNTSGNYEVNPDKKFALTRTSFGIAFNVDADSDLIYAQIANGLNIVGGRNEKIKRTLALPYTPDFVGVNASLNHIYIGSSGQHFVEVRKGDTGRLLGTVTLSGVKVISAAGDYTERTGHIYVAGSSGRNDYLYEIPDEY
jgi:DNA-binding beta-propeller fold protein YncE